MFFLEENAQLKELWYEPADALRKQRGFRCGMSRKDHGFLCTMIRYFNPKKIVEIGVAEGGTTAIIMNCLAEMGSSASLYSVELSEFLYYDETRKNGYICEELKDSIAYKGPYTYLSGKTIAGQIDEIGRDIDFVVLDTRHILPGELLDFLTILPYCTKNAVFLLHDVNLNYYRALGSDRAYVKNNGERIATKLLYSMVTADKYIYSVDTNIAGFQINSDTDKCIDSIFYYLTATWSYLPEDWMIKEYRQLLKKHYTPKQMETYDTAVKNNLTISERMKIAEMGTSLEMNSDPWLFPYEKITRGSKIILYGAGSVGQRFSALLKMTNYCNIVGWLDKNYMKFDPEYQIEPPEELLHKEYDYILVAVEKAEVFQEIKQEILQLSDKCEDSIIGPVERWSY